MSKEFFFLFGITICNNKQIYIKYFSVFDYPNGCAILKQMHKKRFRWCVSKDIKHIERQLLCTSIFILNTFV